MTMHNEIICATDCWDNILPSGRPLLAGSGLCGLTRFGIFDMGRRYPDPNKLFECSRRLAAQTP